MLNLLVSVALALIAGLPAEAQAGVMPNPDDAAGCIATNPTGGDIRVLTCAVTSSRMHRVTVNFGGGHDDTSASLRVTLDGRPADCDAGSKASLFGEDGDVSLHCRIRVGSDADVQHTLVVTVLWSHAQYRDFVFSAE